MLFLLPLEYFGKLFFGGRFVLYEISLRLKSGEHFVLRIIGGNMFVITTEEKPGHAIGVLEVASLKVSNIHGEKQEYEICYFLHKDFRGK